MGRRPPEETDGEPPDDAPGDGSDDEAERSRAEERSDEDTADPERPQPIRPSRRPAGGSRDTRIPREPRMTGGGGGRPPARPSLGGTIRRFALGAILVVIVAIVLLAGSVIDLLTDALWFDSVGYSDVFWARIRAQVGLFALGLVIAALAILGNLWLAGRLIPTVTSGPGPLRGWAERLAEASREGVGGGRMGGGRMGGRGGDAGQFVFEVEDLPDMTPVARWILVAFALLVTLGVAGALAANWEMVLLWANRVPFSPDGGVVDPIFGRDISFFLFELPFWQLVQGIANGLLVVTLLVVGARYAVAASRGGGVFGTRVRMHLGILAGLLLLTIAAGYQLDKLDLAHGTNGFAPGVGFTDANARFFANDLLSVITGLLALGIVGLALAGRGWRSFGVGVGAWIVAVVVVGGLYPEAIQRFTVNPNELAQERQYIANNISMTRLAFGLDRWEDDRPTFRGEAPLTPEAIEDEEATFRNARLWDYRPLSATLKQLQAVRQYYDFPDVDTDRYLIGDPPVQRQVMLSARELNLAGLDVPSWVNQRIIYTHGIGAAMVPVNEVTRPEGQPRLWVRDLPPVASEGAPQITEPRIYFGESDGHYVVVGARQLEFDYPRDSGGGVEDVENRWTGTTGIRLEGLARLAFALRFRDLDLLITDQVTSDSQLLMHRTIGDRVGLIAPFLRYDKDPYLVVAGDGGLVYIQDAYTISDDFPHATSFAPGQLPGTTGLGQRPFDYLRNSVKVVMDAYDGRMTFYVADPTDPLIRAWQGVFPSLFRPLSEFPEDLRPHLRSPEEQFNVQTRMFGRYHLRPDRPADVTTFYNSTDLWTVPAGEGTEQRLPSEAYYVIMRMPGEPEAEFLLLQPMIAASRPNMIAWVAARNDGDRLGTVRVYRFPSNTTVFGPQQIEARIDQDPIISAQISLWDQAGSSVIRGNLLVVPVRDSLLYLQPIYLQSTQSAFPEFERIVVASPTTVVWGETLAQALGLLLEQQGGPAPSPSPTPSPGPTPTPGPTATPGPTTSPPPGGLPTDIPGLVEYANLHYESAQTALRAGDFATYGREIALVEAALQRLSELTTNP